MVSVRVFTSRLLSTFRGQKKKRVALGTPKWLQGARYVSAAARGVVTLLQPPLVATAVTSAGQPAVRRPRSGCSCAGGSTWMATELRDRAAASADGRRVLGAEDGAAATSHHRFFVADTGWRSRRLGFVDISVIFIYILGGAI